MENHKPELYWLRDPEIHRQELFDLTPKASSNRDQFVDALIFHLYGTRIQPENVQEMKRRAKGNRLAKKIASQLEKERKNHIELAGSIRDWVESQVPREDVSRINGTFAGKIVDIELILSRIQNDMEYLSRGVPRDGRKKELELGLVVATLSFWKKYFPENPIPEEAMQGHFDMRGGQSHEPAKPAELCMRVIEFMTGQEPNDISRLFREALARIKDIDQDDPSAIILPL
jgi:hypothetical protein